MKRRTVLRLPLVAAALASTRSLLAQLTESRRQKVMVKAGEDRDNKPFNFLDATFHVMVSGKDNEGRCVIFDTLRPQKVGPRLHYHIDVDEWFFVREGEFKIKAGDEIVRVKAGDSLFIPRNMPHAFVKTSEGTARLIVMHQPAGTMEEFFRTASGFPDQSAAFRQSFAEQHGMRFIGPALTPD